MIQVPMLIINCQQRKKQEKLHLLLKIHDDISKASIRPSDNQTFDCTIFVLEVIIVYGNELRLFWAKAPPYTLFMSHSSHSSSRIHFDVLSYNLVPGRDSNLSPSLQQMQMRYVLLFAYISNSIIILENFKNALKNR